MAQVLGISGSPIPNSNTDRAVQAILEASGLETEFVKLSELSMEPCRACLGCVTGNRCVVRDDGPALAEKFLESGGFVLGAYTPYSSLDARTKTFMERMYCLRHQKGLNRGKPGVFVVTSAMPDGAPGAPPAVATAASQITFWMMEEEMVSLGSLALLGNVPCIRCGYGDSCEVSGVKMLGGPEATVESMGVHQFEDAARMPEKAKELGQTLRWAILGELSRAKG
jgi:multimeric flavodoxin WrbA